MNRTKLTEAEQAFLDRHNNDYETMTTPRGERGIVRAYRVPIQSLHFNPWNPNKTGQRIDEAIGESIKLFGEVTECLVRVHPSIPQAFEIIDGEHRIKQLLKDGIKTAIVNVLLGYSEAELKKLTVAINETRGKADFVELGALLNSIQDEWGDDLIIGLPYVNDELDEILSITAVDWGDYEDSYEEEEDAEEDIPPDEYKIAITLSAEEKEILDEAAIAYTKKNAPPKQDSEWKEALIRMAKQLLNQPNIYPSE